MTNKPLPCSLRVLIAAVILLSPSFALASSGHVQGTLRFHQRNGNFCPAGEDCTDSRYGSAAWNTQVGIPEAVVRLEKADGTLIATSFTSSAGTYSFAWTVDTNGAAAGLGTADVAAKIVVYYLHKDTAFRLRTFADVGSKLQYTGFGSVTLDHGTSAGAPQTSNMTWGTSASPSKLLNTYWAAYMAYRYVLRDLARFTNIDILAFEPTAGDPDCPSSCALGYTVNVSNSANRPPYADQMLTVVLDGQPDTPYWPVERTMHELGHIGDFVSVQGGHFRRTGYDYNDPGVLEWDRDSQEYRPTALNEGLASFIGVASFYGDNATEPMTCTANGNSAIADMRHCYGMDSLSPFNVEESHAGSCAAMEGRWPISAARYMWDIYDSVVDGVDNVDVSDQTILTTMSKFPCSSYPACYADGDLHDQYSSVSTANGGVGNGFSTSAAERDDGNGWHWRNALINSGGADVTNAFNRNCMSSW